MTPQGGGRPCSAQRADEVVGFGDMSFIAWEGVCWS
jgi:hypothetical protein